MAPNSLIFLVIIGVWAAYLGKYWLRRREHLATARSMDRFSESIRVLGQGRVLPTTDVHRAPHRSYAVTPGGPMRPQVTVKRSVAGHVEESVPVPPIVRPVARRVPRPVRGLLLLLALAAFVLSLPLAVLWDRFPAWGPLVVLANAVAAFAFLRAAVQADALVRPGRVAAAPRRAGSAAAPAVSGPAARAPRAEVVAEPVHEPIAEPVAREERVFDDPTPASAHTAPAPAAVSTPAPRRTRAADPVPVEADDDIPATWDPPPVPNPTYAMKQRAGQPAPPVTAPVPEPIELEDDDMADLGRRAFGA